MPGHGAPTRIFDRTGAKVIAQVGEIASQILELREVEPWLRAFYPQHCNHPRCGLHVHMGFQSATNYSRLGDDRYPATILEGMKQWANEQELPPEHPLWDRLSGNSIYCQHIFDFDNQIQNTHKDFDQRRAGHRYTVINYCYGTHGTVECRLLPMFATVDQAISAVRRILWITNVFLVETASKERRLKADIPSEPDVIRESRRIFV